MNPALDIVQQAYHAFGRQDIPARLALVADEMAWECVVPGSLPYFREAKDTSGGR
jgi:ketosteroid isomerase-like protein